MTPTWYSSAQSPPSALAPVVLVDAATSAPVRRERLWVNCSPSTPSAVLQPYSRMSPSLVSAVPIAASSAARAVSVALS